MLALYSVKGGSGVTVTSALLALAVASSGRKVVVTGVDPDLSLVLGLTVDPRKPGFGQWMEATEEVASSAWERLVIPVVPNLGFIQPSPLSAPSISISKEDRLSMQGVVVDAGCVAKEVNAPELLRNVDHALLVIRPCFLALEAAAQSSVRRDGIVVLSEPGRALNERDIQDVLGAEVVASLPYLPSLARSVDAGRLSTTRLRRDFKRPLHPLIEMVRPRLKAQHYAR